jgi:hypothetical protein
MNSIQLVYGNRLITDCEADVETTDLLFEMIYANQLLMLMEDHEDGGGI